MGKRLAAVGLAAGLTAGAAAGLVVGAPGMSGAQSDAPASTDQPSEDRAPDLEARRAEHKEKRIEHLTEVLSPLVEDGTLTQEQADAVIARLGEEMPPPPPPGRGVRGGRGDHPEDRPDRGGQRSDDSSGDRAESGEPTGTAA